MPQPQHADRHSVNGFAQGTVIVLVPFAVANKPVSLDQISGRTEDQPQRQIGDVIRKNCRRVVDRDLAGADRVRLQTVRSGFPCFCAALIGFVEATYGDDRERNRLCPPNTLPDNPRNWAEMQLRGALATRSYGSESTIAAWANKCALNPARIDPARASDPMVSAASARLRGVLDRGISALSELAGISRTELDTWQSVGSEII